MGTILNVTYFEKNTKVKRDDVNKKLEQIDNSFPVTIYNGGTLGTTADTARYNLGGDVREVFYQNSAGTTTKINFSYPYSPSRLLRLGIYYGADNIQHYTEVYKPNATFDAPGYTVDTGTLSMQYLQNNGDLLIRTTLIKYSCTSVRVLAGNSDNLCYHFSTNGNSWSTADTLYIYGVVGFFKGVDDY